MRVYVFFLSRGLQIYPPTTPLKKLTIQDNSYFRCHSHSHIDCFLVLYFSFISKNNSKDPSIVRVSESKKKTMTTTTTMAATMTKTMTRKMERQNKHCFRIIRNKIPTHTLLTQACNFSESRF